MGIGTSDGKYFDTETDYAFDQFSKGQQSNFETKLSKEEESKYQDWKSTYAPNDSGFDYDLRGAFKAGLEPDPTTGHWPDTYKKPNHETFSDQSIYAKDAPHLAGTWDGDKYIPSQQRIDELVAAAPNFANNPVIDQMTATAQRSRPEPIQTHESTLAHKDTSGIPFVNEVDTNSAGWDAFIERAPESTNIEDRRSELKAPGIVSAIGGTVDNRSVDFIRRQELVNNRTNRNNPSVDSFNERFGDWTLDDKVNTIIREHNIDREPIMPGTPTWPYGDVITDAQPYPSEIIT